MTLRLATALLASSAIAAPFAGSALAASHTGGALPQSGDSYFTAAQETLQAKLDKPIIDGQAKNVILFVADGMGPTTQAAIRIFEGQQLGGPGEDHVLDLETLPNLATSKTYNDNAQTPDSAGTAAGHGPRA